MAAVETASTSIGTKTAADRLQPRFTAWVAAWGSASRATRRALVAALIAVVLLACMAIVDPAILYTPQTGPGAFYRVIPWWVMVLISTLTFGFAILAYVTLVVIRPRVATE